MRYSLFVSLSLLLLLSIGCKPADYSKNMRAATGQATATVGVKALLDEVDIEKYESTKVETIKVCEEVKAFLQTGQIAELPVDKAKEAITKFMQDKGWGAYIVMVIGIVDLVESQTVPISMLGQDNIAIVCLGLDSAILSARTSRLEWRRAGSPVIPNKVKVYRGR